MSQCNQYYERFSRIPHEEDMTHEFKGHRNFCSEEIPIWATVKDEHGKTSRKAISRNLCGFLNTGHGGTVYSGVIDDGIVHGLALTRFQRDHVIVSIHDLLNRFDPPVPPHRYKVKFVPVFGSAISEKERKEMLAYNSRECEDPELRKRKHVLRGSEYCWCDQDGIARYKNGTLISEYVIEVTILQWDPDNKLNEGLGSVLNLHPIHADDKGDVYFRRQASLCKYTLQEITRMTYYEVEKRKDKIISRLKNQIADLEASKKKNELEASKKNNELGLEASKKNNELGLEASKKKNELEASKMNNELGLEASKTKRVMKKTQKSVTLSCNQESSKLLSSSLFSLPSGRSG